MEKGSRVGIAFRNTMIVSDTTCWGKYWFKTHKMVSIAHWRFIMRWTLWTSNEGSNRIETSAKHTLQCTHVQCIITLYISVYYLWRNIYLGWWESALKYKIYLVYSVHYRVRWIWSKMIKLLKIKTGHLYSYVKLNFKVPVFTCQKKALRVPKQKNDTTF